MEKIKRLLEEMERNKRSRRGNRYDKEDRYTPGIYRRRMGFRRDDEDEEDEDREFEDRGMENHFQRGGRFGREESKDKKFGKIRHMNSRYNTMEDEDELPEELRDLEEEVWEYIETLKKEDPELFCLLKCDLWKALKGPHFDEEFAEEAVEELCEEHGKREARWKCDEAKQIAEKFGIKFGENFNKHDWFYALNLMYLLFSQVMQDNLQSYAKCAHAWLNDKCIPEGKSFWHYHRFLKSREEE